MNKLVFALIASIAIQAIVSENKCPLYKCLTDGSETCHTYNKAEDGLETIQVQKCKDSTKKCPEAFDSTKNATCTVKPEVTGLPAGEACEKDSNCLGDLKCESKVCAGKDKEAACANDYECKPGLYCDGKNCKELNKVGTTCKSNTECVNNAFCMGEKCVEIFSLDDGQETNNPVLCKSMNMYFDTTAMKTYCASSELTTKDCPKDGPCIYKTTYGEGKEVNTTRPCACKATDSTKLYCPTGTTSDLYKDAIQATKDAFEDAKNKHVTLKGESKKFDLAKKAAKAAFSPLLDDAEDCMLDAYLSTSYLKISFLGLLIFGLLF